MDKDKEERIQRDTFDDLIKLTHTDEDPSSEEYDKLTGHISHACDGHDNSECLAALLDIFCFKLIDVIKENNFDRKTMHGYFHWVRHRSDAMLASLCKNTDNILFKDK